MSRNSTHSSGILLYRFRAGSLEVFLGRANGPHFWKRNSSRTWGIPKGGVEDSDVSLFASAKREFEEETGTLAPDIVYDKLVDFETNYGKTITVFVGDATGVDVSYGGSVVVEKEWPIGSGKFISYREVSDARWIPLKEALNVVMYGQRPILGVLSDRF